MLQKKIDGEKIDMPMINRKGNTPWYRNEVERDIPIPVLGPDLIDLRTVEIAAERTAMGLLDAREAGPAQAAQDPRAAARAGNNRRRSDSRRDRRSTQGAQQDRPDPRQGTG